MKAYYNENDPKAAAQLREFIKAGLVADGDVDERSITDVRGADLAGYAQCHFFAGIGGWPLALRIAGVSPDLSLWAGSCPCQPLSCAGKREGAMDERHLWPVWYSLIAECRPDAIYGEQVASGDGPEWLDGISLDLEELGYAIGAGDLPAACVGAPDIRQRLWWVADAGCTSRGQGGDRQPGDVSAKRGVPAEDTQRCGQAGELADSQVPEWRRADDTHKSGRRAAKAGGSSGARGVANADSERRQGERLLIHQGAGREAGQVSEVAGAGKANFWADYELCWRRKAGGGGEWCRIEPGTFPLAPRLPENVGLLRGYGNAINPWVAAKFIKAHVEARGQLVEV